MEILGKVGIFALLTRPGQIDHFGPWDAGLWHGPFSGDFAHFRRKVGFFGEKCVFADFGDPEGENDHFGPWDPGLWHGPDFEEIGRKWGLFGEIGSIFVPESQEVSRRSFKKRSIFTSSVNHPPEDRQDDDIPFSHVAFVHIDVDVITT